jgi:hypothetical protein
MQSPGQPTVHLAAVRARVSDGSSLVLGFITNLDVALCRAWGDVPRRTQDDQTRRVMFGSRVADKACSKFGIPAQRMKTSR